MLGMKWLKKSSGLILCASSVSLRLCGSRSSCGRGRQRGSHHRDTEITEFGNKHPLSQIRTQLFTLFLCALLLILVLPSLPTASAEVPPELLGSGIGRFNSIICEDVDGDGREEILFGSYEGKVVSVEYKNGEYRADWESPKYGKRCWGLAAGQFDDDPALEIIIGDGDGYVRAVDGETKKEEWKSVELTRDAHGLLLHDVDHDGKNELVVGTGFKTDQGWGQLHLFENNDSKPFYSFEPFDSRLRELDIADVDGDGEEELVVGSGSSLGDITGEGYLRVFDLETRELEWKSPDLEGCIEGLRLTDLDGDGSLEIVASTGYRYREGYCFVYHFEDGEYKRLWKSGNIGPKAYGLAVGDIDEDGVLEIVVSNLAGYIYAFNGLSYQQEWKSKNLGRDILGLCLGDPDGDGELEIIAGQGGYIGKGDYTSGYVSPHVYVIDGKSKEIEGVLGQEDEFLQWLKVAVLVAAVVGLAEVGVLVRLKVEKKKARR